MGDLVATRSFVSRNTSVVSLFAEQKRPAGTLTVLHVIISPGAPVGARVTAIEQEFGILGQCAEPKMRDLITKYIARLHWGLGDRFTTYEAGRLLGDVQGPLDELNASMHRPFIEYDDGKYCVSCQGWGECNSCGGTGLENLARALLGQAEQSPA